MIILKVRNKSKEQGITLIALVITIIVLLILAGVTINLTLKEGGIFSRAQLAAQNYANAQEKELAALEQFDTEVNDRINNVTLKIDDEEGLKDFAEEVNKGKTYEGETIVLQGDINLSGEEWTPIGDGKHPFAGTFDGEGHKVTLNIDSEDECQGLFGYSTGVIKNVGVDGAISGCNSVAGIAVCSTGLIENCYNESDITVKLGTINGNPEFLYGAGICCYSSDGFQGKVTIKNCYNAGCISVKNESGSSVHYSFGAGICAAADARFILEGCFNKGKITVKSNSLNTRTAGIVVGAGRTYCCYNLGEVLSETTATSGVEGVTGAGIECTLSSSELVGCYNNASVKIKTPTMESSGGAILGGNNNGTIQNCYYVKGNADKGISASFRTVVPLMV